MQQSHNYKQFALSRAEGKSNVLQDVILQYIRQALEHSNNCKKILLRSKWIVTELLTNALKHTKADVVHFEVRIEGTVLQIIQSDQGEPFSLSINGKRNYFAANLIENDNYLLIKDDLSTLCATVIDGKLNFRAEDNIELTDLNVQNIQEHFGLIIITRSSDYFTYCYDNAAKTNIFKASIWI